MGSLFSLVLVSSVGALGSLVDTAAGMGFGALSTTILVASGYAPATVVLSVNIAKVPGGIAGAVAHWRLGNIRRNWVIPLVISGVIGGVTGAIYVTSMSPELVRRIVPWLLIVMGVLIIRRAVNGRFQVSPPVAGGSAVTAIGDAPIVQHARRRRRTARPLRDLWLYVIGFAAGALNSATGAFGPFATSGLILARGRRPRHAIGTVTLVEVAVAAAVSITLLARIATSSSGIGWQLPAALTLGAVVAAPAGAWLSSRIPARPLALSVGIVLILINGIAIVRAG
ncbi:MAG: sulfite exporter TauE/SafE family protein [SAR202 cluster bacterium]|nr:sulfite exporter TauE/SafE family protein [SAR202 cluster bacterium]